MNKSFYMQHMLLQYGRQLTTARRLARHRQAMWLARGEDPGIDTDARRRLMVERITGEVVDNLLLSGSENPIVTDVQNRLTEELGETIRFRFFPGELDMRIFKEHQDGLQEVTAEEKTQIMERVWRIAHETVDSTML